MSTSLPTPSPQPMSGEAGSSESRVILLDAIRYWETRRVIYNVALTLVALIWLGWTWPHFQPAMHLETLLPLSVLALLANVCYSAAYLVDIPAQHSLLRVGWRRGRWGLWLAGMLFALLFENYWIADEIYPFVPFVR